MVFFFDLTRYEQWVVSGLQQLAKGGDLPIWISRALADLDFTRLAGEALEGREALIEVLTSPGLDERLCVPFPKRVNYSSPIVPEVWRKIMGILVEVACCSDGVWVMKSGSAMAWESDLEYMEDPLEQDQQACLAVYFNKLSRRMSCWNDGDGGYREGIHGWLSADECAQLSTALQPIGLMDLPASDQSLDKIGQSSMIPYLDCLSDFGEGDSTRGLTLLQAAAKTAASRGLGLAWFNDPRLVINDGWGACRDGSIIWRRLPTTIL
jgi:hypothetical protein